MNKATLIKRIISLQQSEKKQFPVDLVLKNGNLQVRSFLIVGFDNIKKELKGITRLEAYSSLRENRKPSYCLLKVTDIKEIVSPEVEFQPA